MLKKEHLLNYMMRGYIHLSKKDYGFFNNLTFIIKDRQHITSNQNKLFDKLIVKYQRQLRKEGHELVDLQKLEWEVPIIQTLDEYLTPKISLENDILCLRSPFNNKFISDFRSQNDNTFVWDRIDRMYRSPFYTHVLRSAIDMCKKYFDKIEYCDKIKEMIEPLTAYENVNMVPTLVKENEKFYIKNSNKNLDIAIKDIELNGEASTIYQLSQYGVFISDDLLNDDPVLRFASQYNVVIDIDDLLGSIECFKALNITDVCFPARQRSIKDKSIDKSVVDFFNNNTINIHTTMDTVTEGAVYIKRGFFSHRATLTPDKKVHKVIEIVNSRPIDIK